MNRQLELAPWNRDETIYSHASRLAAACGHASAVEFGKVSGFSFKHLTSGYAPHVERYARLLDRPVALFADGVLRSHSKLVEARGEKLTFAQMSRQGLRFCPHCLVEDENSGRGRRGHRSYGRLHWQVNAVRTCPLHEVRLVMADLPAPSMTYDFALMLSAVSGQLPWHVKNGETMAADTLQKYVLDRLDGCADVPWLDAMPLYDAVMLAEIVGAVARHGIDYRSRSLDHREWSRCAGEGFDIVAQGESAFRAFVNDLVRGATVRSDANGRSFLGRLNDLLFFSLENFEGEARRIIREVRAEIISRPRNLSRAEPTSSTVHDLARRCGVRPSKLRQLLYQGGMLDYDEARKLSYHIRVEDGVGERYAVELRQTLDRGDARRKLGASTRVFGAILDDGYLEPRPWTLSDDGRSGPERFAANDVELLLKRVRTAVTQDFPSPGMETISVVVRNSGSTYSEVVQLLLTRKLAKVAMASTAGDGFWGVRLDAEEVRHHSVDASRGYVPTKVAVGMLQASNAAVVKLTEMGLLESSTRRGPNKTRLGTYYHLRAIEAFDKEYVSLQRLARIRGKSVQLLREELAEEEIVPIVVAGGAVIFRWVDLPQG